VRLGYQQALSERVNLGRGEVVTVRLVMSVVASRLAEVRVTERRQYSSRELESTVGFELRRASAVGQFLTVEELSRLGSVSDLGRSAISGGLSLGGNVATEALEFIRGSGSCFPEIILDGQPLIGTPVSLGANAAGTTEMNRERAAAALTHLNAIGVENLYGVEIYRGRLGSATGTQAGPPPRLGGFLQGNACGLVVVWSRMQLARDSTTGVLSGRSKEATTGVQVIRGAVVDADGDIPVAGVTVTLRSPNGNQLDTPVRSDSNGEFVIRTKRVGQIRLDVGAGTATRSTVTPNFGVAPEELVIVRLFVSGKRPVSASMGIEVRALPEDYGATDLGGFSYRRERGLIGQFLGPDEIQHRRAESLGSLLRGIDGVVVSGTSPADTIAMRDPFVPSAQPCRPAYMIDGARVANSIADSTVRALSMSRVIGVEVYRNATETPPVYSDAVEACGLIGIWTWGEKTAEG